MSTGYVVMLLCTNFVSMEAHSCGIEGVGHKALLAVVLCC